MEIVTGVVGLIIGLTIPLLFRKRYDGTLHIEPPLEPGEGPYLFLELETSVDKIKRSKKALFKVDIKSYLTRK